MQDVRIKSAVQMVILCMVQQNSDVGIYPAVQVVILCMMQNVRIKPPVQVVSLCMVQQGACCQDKACCRGEFTKTIFS